ncbi:hypothetical protein GIB67_023257 [Kingdonia uniflora]|uniref:Uncharacterized protein n=1 Tax=Kingdonia uniflora TaxID=39325 RepID=A0A7J7LJC3_9MAGN|nr:hypothetical protein GIB67_023257 [Kingdonia uniflora]
MEGLQGLGEEEEESFLSIKMEGLSTAIEKLPTYDRLRTSIMKSFMENDNSIYNEVDVRKLDADDHHAFIERVFKMPKEDTEKFFKKFRKHVDKGLDPRRFRPLVDDDDVPQSNESFKTICIDVHPPNRPSIPQSNVYLSNEPILTNVPQSNEHFQTIPIDVPLSNEPCISQSNIHLSNEPILTNVPLSNKPMLTNVPLSIEPEPSNGQTEPSAEFRFEPQFEHVKYLVDFRFKFIAYTGDLYDFSKEFNIGDLYRDRIVLKNHIRAYTVVKKFNFAYVLSNEYKIVPCCKGHNYS